MSNQIQRHTLALSDGTQVLYSMVNAGTHLAESDPILLCLHPGWNGELPSPYYGEVFLSDLFLPAFKSMGALLAAPDCPAPAWNHPQALDAVLALIQDLDEDYRIASRKIALVGYSAGGWGAWYIVRQASLALSSAVLIATLPVIDPVGHFEENFTQCGEVLSTRREEWLRGIPDIPYFIIHSAADELFPIEMAEKAYRNLVDNGNQAVFRPVDGVGHFEASGYIGGLKEASHWLQSLSAG